MSDDDFNEKNEKESLPGELMEDYLKRKYKETNGTITVHFSKSKRTATELVDGKWVVISIEEALEKMRSILEKAKA